MLKECYGNKFEVNDAKIKLWGSLLAEYDFNDIQRAVFQHMKNSSFEPKPADIIKLMLPDFDAAFNRMISKQPPADQIEKSVCAAVGYSCRTQLPEQKARELYAKEYKRQIEIAKNPYTGQSRQITHEPEKRPTDQLIDEGAERFKGKNKAEIQAMLNNFKLQTKVKK